VKSKSAEPNEQNERLPVRTSPKSVDKLVSQQMNKQTFGGRKQHREETTKADSQRKNDKLKGKGYAHNTVHSDNRAADAPLTAGPTLENLGFEPRCAGVFGALWVTEEETRLA